VFESPGTASFAKLYPAYPEASPWKGDISMTSRRSILKLLAGTSFLASCADSQPGHEGAAGMGGTAGAAGAASTAADKLIFLGTQGGPRFNTTRGETAAVMLIGGQTYMLDCGYGAFRGLLQAGIDPLTVSSVFLTHLHTDHVADVAALLGLQWTQGRKDPTTVYGPYGTDALVTGAIAFNAADTRIRVADEGRTVMPGDIFKGVVSPATATPTQVFKDANITVTCVENTHYSDTVKAAIPDRSLAYRVDSATRSIVFTGDTTYTDNIVNLAQGADILVCECMDTVATRASFDAQVAMGAYADNPEGVWNHIVGAHTPCADVGRMAAAANVKTLILYHLVPGALNGGEPDQTYIDQITPNFSGTIIVAADQMSV
jgi:ribonuclease BN (tRNA processing enzyme)